MKFVQILTILTCLTTSVSAHGQEEPFVSMSDVECRLRGSTDLDWGEAVIFGNEFNVPSLNIRFVRQNTGEPLIPDEIVLFYMWDWIRWPYPEHAWGVWYPGLDDVVCTTNGQSDITILPHTVRPRGWYAGKYTRFPFTLVGSRRPRFSHIEISIQFGGCSRRLLVDADDLEPYERNIAVINVSCGTRPGRTYVEFQPYE